MPVSLNNHYYANLIIINPSFLIDSNVKRLSTCLHDTNWKDQSLPWAGCNRLLINSNSFDIETMHFNSVTMIISKTFETLTTA